MFKNNKRKMKFDPNMTDTLIGEGSQFEGHIRSEASIRVEGDIKGDITCAGDVTVGEKGSAHSHIKARNIIIAGTVTGNVEASGKLTIKATGQLMGNMAALELSIETGGVFQGTSSMNQKDFTDAVSASKVSEDEVAIAKEAESPLAQPSLNNTASNDPTTPASSEEAASVLKTW